MDKLPEGWKISKRDGENHYINSPPPLTEEEKDKMKHRIVENLKELGFPENLKKELYPELFE